MHASNSSGPGSRLATRATDVVLLLVAGWLLLGPRGPLRKELTEWITQRRQAELLATRWDELVGAGAGLGAGDTAGPILVEFTDYRCPYCLLVQEEVDALLRDRHGPRVVIRHLPIATLHPDAPLLARVSVCAESDDAWPAIHRALFTAPGPDAGPDGTVGDPGAGLAGHLDRAGSRDPAAVLRCAEGDEARRRVAADAALARELGITATPTFVTAGEVRVGALSRDALLEMLGLADP